MTLDDKIGRARELMDKRAAIDDELTQLFAGSTPKARKPQACSKCGEEGHSARTCTKENGGAG